MIILYKVGIVELKIQVELHFINTWLILNFSLILTYVESLNLDII